jgi:hypothetical protein
MTRHRLWVGQSRDALRGATQRALRRYQRLSEKSRTGRIVGRCDAYKFHSGHFIQPGNPGVTSEKVMKHNRKCLCLIAFSIVGLASAGSVFAAGNDSGAPLLVAQSTPQQTPQQTPAKEQDPRQMGMHMQQMGKHMQEMGKRMEHKGMQMDKSGSAMGMGMEGMDNMDKAMEGMDKAMEPGDM